MAPMLIYTWADGKMFSIPDETKSTMSKLDNCRLKILTVSL